MESRELVMKEIEEIASRQPKKLREPLMDVSRKLIAYADTEIGFTVMGMKEKITSLEQAVEAISRKR